MLLFRQSFESDKQIGGYYRTVSQYLPLTLCILSLVCLSAAQEGPGAFSLQDQALALPPGSSDGYVPLWVKWEKAPAEAEKKVPTVADRTSSAGSTKVTFEATTASGERVGERVEWKFTVHVTGLPLNSQLTRKASISLDSTSTDITYTISNTASGTVSWTANGPPQQWIVQANPSVNVMVATGDRPIAAVRLTQSTLQDASTKHQVPADQFIFCKQGDVDCESSGLQRCEVKEKSAGGDSINEQTGKQTPITAAAQEQGAKVGSKIGTPQAERDTLVSSLPARSTTTFKLALCPSFDDAGVFTGVVTLGTSEDASTQAVQLTVLSSGSESSVFGIGCIALGLLTWILASVVLRARQNQNQLRMPFAALQETLETLSRNLDSLPTSSGVGFADVKEALAKAKRDVQHNQEQAIPSLLKSAEINVATPGQSYETQLNSSKDAVAVQVAIIKAMQQAQAHWSTGQQQAEAKAALEDLVALAKTPPTNQQAAEAKINVILAKIPGTVSLGVPGAESLVSVRELQLRNERLSVVTWGLWFVVTAALGVYVLIVTQPGFGTSLDLWKCFFWGVGVPLTGQQLAPSTITSAFNMTLPKA